MYIHVPCNNVLYNSYIVTFVAEDTSMLYFTCYFF